MRNGIYAVTALLVLSLVRPAMAGDEVEKVRSVLQEHPEILVDVLRQQGPALLEIVEGAARGRQEARERARFAIELTKPLKPDLSGGRASLGPAKAPVTIVEYSDFLCHYCGRASGTIRELHKRHPKEIRLVYKHFATGKNDVRAAIYFEAINLQDPAKAWKFMDAVFANQKKVAEKGDSALDALAKGLGVDMKRLAKDVKRDALAKRIKDDAKEARNFGFEGTPVFLINGAPVRGAVPLAMFEDFVKLAAHPDQAAAAAKAKKP